MTPVVTPPIAPMPARLEAEIPLGGAWVYEPKWDGFRGLIFKNANSVHIGSRNRKSLCLVRAGDGSRGCIPWLGGTELHQCIFQPRRGNEL